MQHAESMTFSMQPCALTGLWVAVRFAHCGTLAVRFMMQTLPSEHADGKE